VRGAVSDWYPYPFFDHNWDALSAVNIPSSLYIICITILFGGIFYLLGFVMTLIWNKKGSVRQKSIVEKSIEDDLQSIPKTVD